MRISQKIVRVLIMIGVVCYLVMQPIHSVSAWPGYRLLYKEQIYELYHEHLYMYPENFAENIMWLETVLRSDFANPLNALARIETKQEWEWYRNNFNMHINLMLTRQYLTWGKKYTKEHAYFFNAPWRDMNLRSMEKAKKLMEFANVYWQETQKEVEKITAMDLYFMNLPEIQYWEDEYHRIINHKLDYQRIIDRELGKIATLTKQFTAMDENTY